MHDRPYSFDVSLNSIRILLGKQTTFNVVKESEYDDIQALVITLEEWLRDRGYGNKNERKRIRLAILSLITDKTIGTTYDLTKYQAKTIYHWLTSPETNDLREHGRHFLEDCEARVQS